MSKKIKDIQYKLLFPPQKYAEITKAAETRGMPLSVYIRQAVYKEATNDARQVA